jgi:hypothetical protein
MLSLGLQFLPELPGREDGKIPDMTDIQKLPVAGHEHIGSSRYRSRQNAQVVLIRDVDRRQLTGLRKYGILSQ